MNDYTAGLTGFLAQDPIAETVRALDDPFTAEGVPGQVREGRAGLDKAPADKQAQMTAGLQLLADLYGPGRAPEGPTGESADAVRAWLRAAAQAWRTARSGADRLEVSREVARLLGAREDGAARLAPYCAGWGSEPLFAAEVLSEWPQLDRALQAHVERAAGALAADPRAWPRLAAGHALQRERIGGGTPLALPAAPPVPGLAADEQQALDARRARRQELIESVAETARSGSSQAFQGWEQARDMARLAAALEALAPFARDEARAKQVQEALASATRLLEDERLDAVSQPELPALVQAAMRAVQELGRKLKPDPALACIRAASGALERSSPPGLAEAVEVRLAHDAVLGALSTLPPAVALEPLLQRVNAALARNEAPGGPGFARAVGALLGSDAPGARGERLQPLLTWLRPALLGEGRARVLAAQALWEALDRCVLSVGTGFARTWFAGTSGAGAPPLAAVALAALDVVFPAARLDPERLAEPTDRLHDKVRTRAQELVARPSLGEATRRAVLLWLEASAMIERRALESCAAACAPESFPLRPLGEKVELLTALAWLLRGDVLPPPRVEAAGLQAGRALYAPDQEAARDLPAAAVRELDAARWRHLAALLSGSRADPVLADALLALVHGGRLGRPGDAPGAARAAQAASELEALLALVRDDLPKAGEARLGETLALALLRLREAEREAGRQADPVRALAQHLAARPAGRLLAWVAAASPGGADGDGAGELRAVFAAGAALLVGARKGEARLALPEAAAGSPFAAALTRLDDAIAALRLPEKDDLPPLRPRLAALGDEVVALAGAVDGARRLLGGSEELAGPAARAREALAAAAVLPLADVGGRASLLDVAVARLGELAGRVRALAPAPEHERGAARLDGWIRSVRRHKDRFSTRVEQLVRTGQLEPLLDLGWDEPDEVLLAALDEPRPRRVVALLARFADRYPDRLTGERAPGARRACDLVRQTLARGHDLQMLLLLTWESPETLLRSAEEAAAGRPQELLAFLGELAARRQLDLASPAARQAWEAVRAGFLRQHDLPGLAAAMQTTTAGPLAWSVEAREELLERARRELGDDPRALRGLLEVVARAPGAEEDSPAWRRILQELVERHAGGGEHELVHALMTSPQAGPYRWSPAFAPLHRLATSPFLLVILALPFLAARFASDLAAGMLTGLLALLGAAAVWLLAGGPLQREACLPGLMARIALPTLFCALLGRVWALPLLSEKGLLGLVAVCGVGAWLLLAAAGSRRVPQSCAVRGALSTLTLGVLTALGLALAFDLVLPPPPPVPAGAHALGPFTFHPAVVLAWTALGVFSGAALQRATSR